MFHFAAVMLGAEPSLGCGPGGDRWDPRSCLSKSLREQAYKPLLSLLPVQVLTAVTLTDDPKYPGSTDPGAQTASYAPLFLLAKAVCLLQVEQKRDAGVDLVDVLATRPAAPGRGKVDLIVRY